MRTRAAAMAAWVGFAAGPVLGVQPGEVERPATVEPGAASPSADAALQSPGVERVLLEQQRRARRDESYAPVSMGAPLPPRGVPEGMPLNRAAGRLGRGVDGGLIFRPEGAGEGVSLGEMPVLPGTARVRMEELLAGSASGETPVVVSGQVYTYNGTARVLVSSFSLGAGAAEGQREGSAGRVSGDAGAGGAAGELGRELEATRAQRRLLSNTMTMTTVAPAGEARGAGGGWREGQLITGRTARLLLGADGEPTIAFDNDPDSPAAVSSVSVVPTRMRERLEATLGGRAEGPRVRVSGRVLVERERVFLLVSFFQAAPEGEISTRQ